jgi:two-component system NtrC family sensor kinase
MASLGKLAAVVAHELNNPLTGIRTYARVLRRGLSRSSTPSQGAAGGPSEDGGDASETDRILALMENEAARCGEIVRNMLLFSRESPARFADADLRPVIARCLLLLRHQAELLGVALHGDVAPDLPRIVCDAGQVEQMLLALSMNALEATPSGGEVRLSARRAPESGGIALTVADTGCGIPPDDQARIYEPFFTTKEQGKGVGLGLAVVYGIVNRHHGRIELASRPGATVFTVHLPARPLEGTEGKEASS